MRSSLPLFLFLSLPIFFPACSDGDGSGGTSSVSGSAANVDQFVASVADMYCAKAASCCASRGLDGSGNQCRSLISASKSKSDPSKYDPAKGQACLDQLKAAASATPDACQFLFSDETLDTPACESALPPKGGTKAPGEPCSENEECARPDGAEAECYKQTIFENGGSKTTSYCRTFRPGKENDAPCFWTVDGDNWFSPFSGSSSDKKPTEGFSCNVADGLHCADGSDGAPPACKRLIASGGACSFADKCEKGLFCKQGTCAPRGAVGAACDTFSFKSCVDDAFCESESKTCQAKKAPGTACELSEECKEGSCENSVCKKGGGLEDFALTFLCGPG
jgi:hypothetical protein